MHEPFGSSDWRIRVAWLSFGAKQTAETVLDGST